MIIGCYFNLTAALLLNGMDNTRKDPAAYLENSEVLLRFFSKSSESQ